MAPGSFDELIPRELDVLRLITKGLRDRKIATRLVTSESGNVACLTRRARTSRRVRTGER